MILRVKTDRKSIKILRDRVRLPQVHDGGRDETRDAGLVPTAVGVLFETLCHVYQFQVEIVVVCPDDTKNLIEKSYQSDFEFGKIR